MPATPAVTEPSKTRSVGRRRVLQVAAGAAVATPYFAWSPRSLAEETKSKNDRRTIGVIGAGGMATGNIDQARGWVDVVAIADVDTGRAAAFNKKFSNGKADVYNDYRPMLERDDIDVLHIATPDHWHTKPLIEAMLAGKDVYCEKPMTLTIDEGKQIRKVQKQTEFNVKYPGGTEMIIRDDTRNGVLITGDKGKIFVSRRDLGG